MALSSNRWIRRLIDNSVALGLVLVSTVFALLAGELILRLAVNPGDFLFATLIDDPILGHRIKPLTTGHDAFGFRNVAAPQRVSIVAIGDSQTYGVNAARDSSWPHQIGNLLHEPVYNMALGAYGPLEYLYLATQEAKKLQPRQLLVGFYFGNDLIEACRAAHLRPFWHGWREADPAEACDPRDQQILHTQPEKRFAVVREWLSGHSVLYSVLRATLLTPLASYTRSGSRAPPDRELHWIDPSNRSVRTVFTPQSRLSVLDAQLPQVREGLRITKRVFSRLKSVADTEDMRLLIVLIPTKERAYCRYLMESGAQLPVSFISLCDAEARVKEDLIGFLGERNIAYVDVTRAMEEQIHGHVQLYPTNSDGHPLATGYGVIARAVFDAMRRHH